MIVNCPTCGFPYDDRAPFCPGCGRATDAMPAPQRQPLPLGGDFAEWMCESVTNMEPLGRYNFSLTVGKSKNTWKFNEHEVLSKLGGGF